MSGKDYDYYESWHRNLQRDCCPECHKVYGSPDGIRGRNDLYDGPVYDHEGNATKRILTPRIRQIGHISAWRASRRSTSTRRRRENHRVKAGSVPSTTSEVVAW